MRQGDAGHGRKFDGQRGNSAIPMLAAIFSLLASGPVVVQSAAAVDLGNIEMGSRLATDVCAQCHAVEADDDISIHLNAPPFQSIADRPEMTELALGVWFRSPHPTMPNYVLTPDDTADLIAYIFSLRKDGS
jgi:mono/diheme cytochrome c family protein